jgi:DNA-binding response OmpR family regulator
MNACNITGRISQRLLTYLVRSSGRHVKTEDLVNYIWDGRKTPLKPVNNISVLLNRMRKSGGLDVAQCDIRGYPSYGRGGFRFFDLREEI